MSRLAKTVVTEREDFVRTLFRENLRLTGLDIQNKLKEKFGKMMRPNRIYELKREITVELLGAPVITLTRTNDDGTTTVTEAPTANIEVVEPLTAAEAAGTLGSTVDTVSTVG